MVDSSLQENNSGLCYQSGIGVNINSLKKYFLFNFISINS
jgi:hypothetical protein